MKQNKKAFKTRMMKEKKKSPSKTKDVISRQESSQESSSFHI